MRFLISYVAIILFLASTTFAIDDGEFGTCEELGIADIVDDSDGIQILEEYEPIEGTKIDACASCVSDGDFLASYGAIEISSTRECCADEVAGCNCHKENLRVDLEKVEKLITEKQKYLAGTVATEILFKHEADALQAEFDKLLREFNPAWGAILTAGNLVANLFPWAKCGKAVRLAKALSCPPGAQAAICLAIAKRNLSKKFIDLGKKVAEKKYNDFLLQLGRPGAGVGICEGLIDFVGGGGAVECLTLFQAEEKFTDAILKLREVEFKARAETMKLETRINELQREANRLRRELAKPCRCKPGRVELK